MPKKPPKKSDRLKPVLKITLGPQAKERADHNKRPQPGDIRIAQSPEPERDRLDRAIKRAYSADLKQREAAKEGRPQPGEILTADSGPTEEQVNKEKVRRFLRLAQERFKLAAEAESATRKDALDDLDFRVGNQWPRDLEMSRTLDSRPCLTMNRLPATIRQVTNEQRQQRPSIQVNPVGDGADKDTAEILQGTVRHIEVASDAEIAYDTAFEQMVTSGFGFWRVMTEVIDPATNQQEIRIKRVKNPFSIYWDPAAVEPCYEDARYCFVIEDVPISEYEEQYGDTDAAKLSDFSSVGDNAPDWATKDTIRVAEYFYVKETHDESGQVQRKVKWAKINAVEIIDGNEDKTEGRDLPGQWITVIPVLGDDLDVNGKRHIAGLVRHAKDPQRMYNYWVSAATELIALAPKAPFVAAEGQIKNHEAEWRDANVRNFAVLQYKPVDTGQHLVPPPQRQVFEPPVQSINLMTRQADLDLKATTGLFDPSLGQNKSDQSGKAIQSLQKQGDIATLNFSDNLARSIRHCGRVLIDLIPKIYDAARVQRIVNPDQSVDHVIIHNQQPMEAQALLTDKIKRIYDIGVGRYDVTVSVGPSYQTKRQESVAAQMALISAYPQVFSIIGDMLVRNMDWPQAKEMSERLKKTLPPQLQDEKSDDPEAKVLQLQAQLQAISQQHEALVQVVNKQNQIIQTKQVESQGKMDIERMKIEAQLTIAEINAKTQELQTRLKLEQDMWNQLHGSAHEVGMQATEQANARAMAEQAAAQPTGNEANQ